MAHHHDIVDLQHLDGIFERCRGGMKLAVGLVGRHHVGNVAHDEEPRPARNRKWSPARNGNRNRRSAAYGASALIRQNAVALALVTIATAHEIAVARQKSVRKIRHGATIIAPRGEDQRPLCICEIPMPSTLDPLQGMHEPTHLNHRHGCGEARRVGLQRQLVAAALGRARKDFENARRCQLQRLFLVHAGKDTPQEQGSQRSPSPLGGLSISRCSASSACLPVR